MQKGGNPIRKDVSCIKSPKSKPKKSLHGTYFAYWAGAEHISNWCGFAKISLQSPNSLEAGDQIRKDVTCMKSPKSNQKPIITFALGHILLIELVQSMIQTGMWICQNPSLKSQFWRSWNPSRKPCTARARGPKNLSPKSQFCESWETIH